MTDTNAHRPLIPFWKEVLSLSVLPGQTLAHTAFHSHTGGVTTQTGHRTPRPEHDNLDERKSGRGLGPSSALSNQRGF
jgi:hypothetical protein